MREVCELRVQEEFASAVFAEDEGRPLSDSVRAVLLDTTDPRFTEVGRLNTQLYRQHRRFLFHGWELKRRYTRAELAAGELFHLIATVVLEPEGESCGTHYDYSGACKDCGMPRKQLSDLRLDLRKVPKKKDIAATIADDEWIISQRLAELIIDANLTGFDLRPVRHKARYADDAINLKGLSSGRELLKRAEDAGAPHPTGEFWCWLNRADQAELLAKAEAEHLEQCERKASRRGKSLPVWHQLIVTSPPVPTVPPSRYGIDPFDEDRTGKYRCSHGHVAGLNLLSEISVVREDWDGSDICCTRELVGMPRRRGDTHGVRVPAPMLLISPRFRSLLLKNKIIGFRTDVAYLR